MWPGGHRSDGKRGGRGKANKPNPKERRNKMKKLMIAMAAVGLAGVTLAANNCVPNNTPPTVTDYAAVFAWKFTGKTTTGVLIKSAGTPAAAANNCTPAQQAVQGQTCAVRVPGSVAIQGYTYVCNTCCDVFKDTTGAVAPDKFYMTQPFKTGLATQMSIDVAHIIGRTARQYEAKGVVKFTVNEAGVNQVYDLTFAGLGNYDQTKKIPTSISGNFAGTVKAPYYIAPGACVPASWWQCLDTVLPTGDATEESVAYGTWSVRYNAGASNAYGKKGITVKLPTWVQ